MPERTFHSDNGGECSWCKGTIKEYRVSADDLGLVFVRCYSCHRREYFRVPPETSLATAAEVAAVERELVLRLYYGFIG